MSRPVRAQPVSCSWGGTPKVRSRKLQGLRPASRGGTRSADHPRRTQQFGQDRARAGGPVAGRRSVSLGRLRAGTASTGIVWDPARRHLRGSGDRARSARSAAPIHHLGGRERRVVALRHRHERRGARQNSRTADLRLAAAEQRPEIVTERQGFGDTSGYQVSAPGESPDPRPIAWRGLLPKHPHRLADWIGPPLDALKTWAVGVRHLRCPRRLLRSPFRAAERAPARIGPDGRDTPLALAADDALRASVRDWYRTTFGVRIDLVAQGSYLDLVTGTPLRDDDVRIGQAGRGLSHVLPVAVTALFARRAGSGVDIIERPEAELHPAAHADIAELLLENLAGPARPLIVETHSEMILLRARRWVAERRLPAGHVLVYWFTRSRAADPHWRRSEYEKTARWRPGRTASSSRTTRRSSPSGVLPEARSRHRRAVRTTIDTSVANDPDAHRWLDRILHKD